MGIFDMINNENYDISFNLILNEKKIIYCLILNGIIIISSFIFNLILSLSIISYIFSILFFVTIGIIINYFILTKLKIFKEKKLLINNEMNAEIEEFQTIMK
jgi:hypothetical protein